MKQAVSKSKMSNVYYEIEVLNLKLHDFHKNFNLLTELFHF